MGQFERVVGRAYAVQDVACTGAGVAGLLYLLDSAYDFDQARPATKPVPCPQSCDRAGVLCWVRGAGSAPGSAPLLAEHCYLPDKVSPSV